MPLGRIRERIFGFSLTDVMTKTEKAERSQERREATLAAGVRVSVAHIKLAPLGRQTARIRSCSTPPLSLQNHAK